MPAGAAADEGIVATAIHQEHGLFAPLHTLLQRRSKSAAENGTVAAVQLAAHVDDLNLGQGAVHHAAWHLQQRVIPAAGLGKGKNAGGGAAQKQGRVFYLTAEGGHVPRIIAGVTVAEIGLLVLLVHHNKT